MSESDHRRVPAIVVNGFAISNTPDGKLRIAFGEQIDEGNFAFYSAVQFDRETARYLLDAPQKHLGYSQGGALPEGGDDTGSPGITIRSTRFH